MPIPFVVPPSSFETSLPSWPPRRSGRLQVTGLRIDLASNPPLVAAAIGYGALPWFYHSLGHDERLATGLETTGQMLLTMLLGIVISYPAAVTALPYRDAELYAIDQWLGFDRRAYVDLVRHQAWLVTAVNIVYQTMQPQLALVPLALFLAGRLGRLQRFEPQVVGFVELIR